MRLWDFLLKNLHRLRAHAKLESLKQQFQMLDALPTNANGSPTRHQAGRRQSSPEPRRRPRGRSLSLASGSRAYGDLESFQFLKEQGTIETQDAHAAQQSARFNDFDTLVSETAPSPAGGNDEYDTSHNCGEEARLDMERGETLERLATADEGKDDTVVTGARQPFSRSSTRSYTGNESQSWNAYQRRMQQSVSLVVDTSLCTIPPGFDRRRRSSVKPSDVAAAVEANRRYSLSVSVSGVSCDEGASVGYPHSEADSDRTGASNYAASEADSRSPSQRNLETIISPHSGVSADSQEDRSLDDASSVGSSDSILIPEGSGEATLTPKLRCPKAWRKFLGLDASMFQCAPTASHTRKGAKGQGQPRYWKLKTNSRMIPKKQCHQLILQVRCRVVVGCLGYYPNRNVRNVVLNTDPAAEAGIRQRRDPAVQSLVHPG
jgi:hypothetical protein